MRPSLTIVLIHTQTFVAIRCMSPNLATTLNLWMFSCNARDKNEKEKIQTSHKYRFQTRLCWQSFRSLGIISGGDVNCLRLSEKGAKKEKKTSVSRRKFRLRHEEGRWNLGYEIKCPSSFHILLASLCSRATGQEALRGLTGAGVRRRK